LELAGERRDALEPLVVLEPSRELPGRRAREHRSLLRARAGLLESDLLESVLRVPLTLDNVRGLLAAVPEHLPDGGAVDGLGLLLHHRGELAHERLDRGCCGVCVSEALLRE